MIPTVYKHLVHGDVHGAVSEALEKTSKGWSRLVRISRFEDCFKSHTNMPLIVEERDPHYKSINRRT
jgi:hypothetical protein